MCFERKCSQWNNNDFSNFIISFVDHTWTPICKIMTAENTLVTFVSNNIWITDTFSIFIITTYRLGSIFITKTFCKYFVHMSNSLFRLTLKITWSLAKILSGNCQIMPCSRLDSFVSRFHDYKSAFWLFIVWSFQFLNSTLTVPNWQDLNMKSKKLFSGFKASNSY